MQVTDKIPVICMRLFASIFYEDAGVQSKFTSEQKYPKEAVILL
jgi:hypothetical protein